MACYVIYLKLSINAQLVLEPFQFVIVQLQLSDSFQIAAISIGFCLQFACRLSIMQYKQRKCMIVIDIVLKNWQYMMI